MHDGESLASDKRGSDLKSGGEEISLLFLFRKMNLERVQNEASWTFNNHLLVFHRMDEGEDSPKVPLIYTWFWVQVHGVPLGHNDSFCKIWMAKGEEVDMGWNLSLRAQSRRALAMNST
ncbi:hypothetical protein Godav_006075 [Gossypium davidsonii]|uniref:DUF4283 domain-containing protein n=1 Tax=Gossypium davidsonii TaxID=34287 RepID=A0A7J8S2J2_GOSDV|nr:hypothetical protein [Gossypium davidsonii]